MTEYARSIFIDSIFWIAQYVQFMANGKQQTKHIYVEIKWEFYDIKKGSAYMLALRTSDKFIDSGYDSLF